MSVSITVNLSFESNDIKFEFYLNHSHVKKTKKKKQKKTDKTAGKLTLCENEELGRFSSISRGRCVWVGGGGGGGGVGVWSGGRGGGGIHTSGMEMKRNWNDYSNCCQLG